MSPNLYLGGFELDYQLGCSRYLKRETAGRPCRCCRGIIASFPIKFVIDNIEGDNNPFCIPMMDQLEVFAKRRDGKEFLRTDDGKNLIEEIVYDMLNNQDEAIGPVLCDFYPDPVIDAFVEKIGGTGSEGGFVWSRLCLLHASKVDLSLENDNRSCL